MGIVNETLEVFVICSDQAGFSDRKVVTAGTTVLELFSEMTGSAPLDRYKVRVNRESVPKEYVLQQGDRVTITPSKIEGAR
jgi:molybdopterin converting factor small subunit